MFCYNKGNQGPPRRRLRSARLGLGAPLPKEVLDGDANRQELSSNDKLRKQLLGKDFRKLQAKSIGGRGGLSRSGVTQPGSKPRPINTERALDHDDKDEDEEGGRSSVGRSKRHRLDAVMTVGDEQEGIVAESKAPNEAFESTSSRSTKRSRSYLDQILQEKSHKKQKKKKQKEETSRQETV